MNDFVTHAFRDIALGFGYIVIGVFFIFFAQHAPNERAARARRFGAKFMIVTGVLLQLFMIGLLLLWQHKVHQIMNKYGR